MNVAKTNTSINNAVSDWSDFVEKMDNQIKEYGQQVFQEVVESIFDQCDGLNVFMIRGWTPSWNDGEECTHSSDIITGEISNRWPDYDEGDKEVFEDENGEQLNTINFHGALKNLIEKTLPIAERVYNTNFEIICRRANGQIEVEFRDYDCGY